MALLNNSERIDALTGIRALAAIAVVGYHFNTEFDRAMRKVFGEYPD